jgi:hypothetical protein
MTTSHDSFEVAISTLTKPLNGQYPRPWMTDLTDPLSANVFIVGQNQRNGYAIGRLTHERHVAALFNRNGESCRRVYDEMTGLRPSPTRQNTDRFRRILEAEGISRVIETNVVCYATPMSSDLRLPEHIGGKVRGSEIFLALLHFIQPTVLIAHGSGTRDTLTQLLHSSLPAVPGSIGEAQCAVIGALRVFVIPSLAPPKWNQWQNWAEPYLAKVAKAVAGAL